MPDPTFRLATCRGLDPAPGARPCPHALPCDADMAGLLTHTLAEAGWPAFLAEKEPSIRRHQAVKIALAGCPNACTGPQVADFGLIRACRPGRESDRCTGCGACAAACPEKAVTVTPDGPVIDRKICLGCGLCVRACPHEALTLDRLGWRVMAGGRLGRHPALAVELPGLFSDAEAAACLARLTAFFMARHRPGVRLSALLPTDAAAFGHLLRGTASAPARRPSPGRPRTGKPHGA